METRSRKITDPNITVHSANGYPSFRYKVMTSRKHENFPWIIVWKSKCINCVRSLISKFSFRYNFLCPLRGRILRNLRFNLMHLPINDDSCPVINLTGIGYRPGENDSVSITINTKKLRSLELGFNINQFDWLSSHRNSIHDTTSHISPRHEITRPSNNKAHLIRIKDDVHWFFLTRREWKAYAHCSGNGQSLTTEHSTDH